MITKILKKGFVLILLSGLVTSLTFAQQSPKTWEWAKNIVGTAKNYPYSLITDKDGNSYVAGGFTDTLKVGKTMLVSRGYYDIYILKYNSNGDILWAKQEGGTDADEAFALAFDSSGFVYMTGYFSGTASFDNYKMVSDGDRDFFVAKFNTDGNVVWVKQGGGKLQDYGTAIATDKSGNIFVTGIFHGEMAIGGKNFVSKGDEDIFIIKYSSGGEVLWAHSGGGKLTDVSTDITTDAHGNCYLTGYFSDEANFDKKIVVSSGKEDIFLAKYNPDGVIQWLKRAGSSFGDDHPNDVEVDNDGNIYLTGYFSGLAYFGNIELKNLGSDDIFLAKYDSLGNAKWAKQTGGQGKEHSVSMKLDKNKNIYITGEFNTDFIYGEDHIKSIGDWDVFVLKYSNTGQMLGGTQIGGVGYDKAYALGLDASANIYIVGYFTQAIEVGSTKLTSFDEDDGFIAKLKNF